MQIFWSFLAAVIGWLTLEFVGRPFRKFFDLRAEVIRLLTQHANVRARYKPIRDSVGAESGDMEEVNLTKLEIDQLDTAVADIRGTAAKMRAFALNETLAGLAIKCLGYDPFRASAALIGLSNAFDTYGDGKNFQRKTLMAALKLPEA